MHFIFGGEKDFWIIYFKSKLRQCPKKDLKHLF